MQRIEDADIGLACGFEGLTHVRDALVGFSDALQAIPYFAALGNEIVVRIDNEKAGEVLCVRHVGHVAMTPVRRATAEWSRHPPGARHQ
jgi:hypothetical protein